MKDERIEQAKNKIKSEMAIIIFVGVIVSFLVKTLIFNMNLQECIIEYVIMIFFPMYQHIRMHMMKISIYSDRGNKQSIKTLIITIVVLVVASVVSIFYSMRESLVYNWQNAVVRIFIFVVLFGAIFFIANKYNQYRGHKYEKEFDDDK